MLKPVPNGTASLRRPLSPTRHLLIDTTPQALTNPLPTSSNPTSSNPWQNHINRDAPANDAQYTQQSREDQATSRNALRSLTPDATAEPARLIEISPEKKPVSRNANLLIDLDVESVPEIASRPHSYAHAPSSRGGANAKVTTNLLD
jgi:hypothetical protein